VMAFASVVIDCINGNKPFSLFEWSLGYYYYLSLFDKHHHVSNRLKIFSCLLVHLAIGMFFIHVDPRTTFTFCLHFWFVGLAYQGEKDIVFRFIIE
jgi:hypothetical protein